MGIIFLVKSMNDDLVMDRCHYAVPFKGISIRSTPEIVFFSSKLTTNNYKKAKMKGGLLDDKL